MAELQPLTFLSQALVEAGYQSPGYQPLFEAASERRIPAKPTGNGRWVFDPADLRTIARVLMLKPVAA